MSDDELIWFYLLDGKSLGPCSKSQLIKLAFDNSITKETLIWSSIQKEKWIPLKDVFNLKEELPPPLPKSNTYSKSVNTKISKLFDEASNYETELQHPWRRFFARALDNIINGSIMWLSIGIILVTIAPINAKTFITFIIDPENKFLNILPTLFLLQFFNSIFIGFTGSSLGKWFFGVRVLDQFGRCIGYRLALKREFLVWLYGLGIGIPLVMIFTLLRQKSNLEKNKILSWDKSLNLQIKYRKTGTLQNILSILGFILIILNFITFIHE